MLQLSAAKTGESLNTWRIIPGLGYVVNNYGDRKSPKDRFVGPLPFRPNFMAKKMEVTNHIKAPEDFPGWVPCPHALRIQVSLPKTNRIDGTRNILSPQVIPEYRVVVPFKKNAHTNGSLGMEVWLVQIMFLSFLNGWWFVGSNPPVSSCRVVY